MGQKASFNLVGNEEFEYIMEVFGRCTDDYLFLLDLDKNEYSISKGALEKFNLPCAHFPNATKVLGQVIHPEDMDALVEDLEDLRQGDRTGHDMEYRWVDREGRTVWISCRGTVIREEAGGNRVLVGRITEIGSRRKADNVTGLFAGRQLQIDYGNICKAGGPKQGVLLRIGVDNFKEVNERQGLEVGDNVLKLIAQCIKETCGADRFYKGDGDEFLVLLAGGDVQKARKKYHLIRCRMEQKRKEQGYQSFYTISSGIVGFSYGDMDFESLSNFSEFALGMAKKNGKNCSYVFSRLDYANYMKNLDIQEKLRYAVNHGFEGFEVYYQPIISMETEQVTGAEALLRFSCEKYGMLPPDVFIPILEESGLIIPVGEWVYQTAMRQSMEWQRQVPNFRININLSFIQICKSDVVSGIMDSIQTLGINPRTVLFEFTETGMISYDDSVQRLLDVLNENQVKLGLDDFGTGYSSLAYLKNLRVTLLKLDRGFTSKAVSDEFDFNLIGHIVDMAHSIGMGVCFEGVETEEERKKLRELGPDYMQGYYYGRPVDRQAFYEENLRECPKV